MCPSLGSEQLIRARKASKYREQPQQQPQEATGNSHRTQEAIGPTSYLGWTRRPRERDADAALEILEDGMERRRYNRISRKITTTDATEYSLGFSRQVPSKAASTARTGYGRSLWQRIRAT